VAAGRDRPLPQEVTLDGLSTVLVVVVAFLFLAPPIYVGIRAVTRLMGKSKDEVPPGPDGL
jgi:hypothetical protein